MERPERWLKSPRQVAASPSFRLMPGGASARGPRTELARTKTNMGAPTRRVCGFGKRGAAVPLCGGLAMPEVVQQSEDSCAMSRAAAWAGLVNLIKGVGLVQCSAWFRCPPQSSRSDRVRREGPREATSPAPPTSCDAACSRSARQGDRRRRNTPARAVPKTRCAAAMDSGRPGLSHCTFGMMPMAGSQPS